MYSTMKSAGYGSSSIGPPIQWFWANGIAPDSNQQSNTSGTRRIMPRPDAEGHVISSIAGRCRSVTSMPDVASSAAIDDGTYTS